MKNTLVSIGYLGIGYRGVQRVYLNVSREEALKRYCASEECEPSEVKELLIGEFTFDDEFSAYSVWA